LIFAQGEGQRSLVENVKKICARFDDVYWTEKDQTKSFPFEFPKAMADAGWLGITMPEELGGANLGVTEAALMMHTVAKADWYEPGHPASAGG